MLKKILLPIISAIILLTVAGCGLSQSNSDKSKQVTIAMLSIMNDEMIARSWYAEELGKALGIKVILLNYDSGMLANDAMATGNIDIALMGSTAAAAGISKGLPYEIFWIHSIDGENECLVAKNAANINSVAELKGKRIGVPPASTAQYSLFNVLKSAKIGEEDVMIIEMQPSTIIEAWQQGKIDAAFVWQPYLEKLLDDGRVLVTGRDLAEKGLGTADVGVVNREFAQKHPEVLEKYISLQVRADQLFQHNPQRAAELAAKNCNETSVAVLNQMKKLVWVDLDNQMSENCLGTSEHKGRLVQTLEQTAKFLEKIGVIDRAASSEVFEQAVNPSFVEAVAKK